MSLKKVFLLGFIPDGRPDTGPSVLIAAGAATGCKSTTSAVLIAEAMGVVFQRLALLSIKCGASGQVSADTPPPSWHVDGSRDIPA
jgi:hypothetical protein